ncbi:MAG: hypothetical protein IJJ14_07095 [Coriobacteriales bacterium]|nr:hypothetical protein [Coriobacteriales bacterium]MBQ6586519.1 hypothetical protein [Coriobacteriales bacterium]
MTEPRKRRRPVIGLVAAIALALITSCISACTHPAPSSSQTEPLYLVVSDVNESTGWQSASPSGNRYVRDAQGNLVEIAYHGADVSKCSYEYSPDGFLESMTIHWANVTSSGSGDDQSFQIINTLDSRGRLATSTVLYPRVGSLTVDYKYYGDSDSLSSALYAVSIFNDEYASAFFLLAGFLEHSAQFPGLVQLSDAAWVWPSIPSASYRATFTKNGQLKRITSGNGFKTYYANECPGRADRAGRTIVLDAGNGSETITFDKAGNVAVRSYPDDTLLDTTLHTASNRYAYEIYDNPSRGAYIFGRLYE